MKEFLETGYSVLAKDRFATHIDGVQKLLSSNVYKKMAKSVLNKYNLTIDMPDIQRALYADVLASENIYKKDFKKMVIGLGMDYHEAIPTFVHHRKMKDLINQKAYKAK